MRGLTLAAAALGAILVTAACGGHSAGNQAAGSQATSSQAPGDHSSGSQTAGGQTATVSHSQVVNAAARDCEATVKSLATGSGGATPTSYKSSVDQLAAELTALANRDGQPQEAAALLKETADLSKYAADIGGLSNAVYQHSTAFLSQQPIKGDLNQTIADSQTLKQRYGIVCIPV